MGGLNVNIMAEEASISTSRINQLATGQKFGIAIGVAVLIALLSSIWMWGQTPEYRVLYSNLSDRDGGAIIESLQQQNIPYKFSDGGGALMVPANVVYETRLKMATLGLPKGGNVGFELMENQKFGISQFAEQVNYQRALEGELARSVQSIASVQSARVHLAIPKPTVFIKEQQKPTASVVLTLNGGRLLDSAQVSAIVHLISSSVPDMSAKNVTVVDQSGTLLSANHDGIGDQGLDPNQLKYIQQIERSYVQRVEAILVPLLGAANVHAQVTADIDFSQSEQTAEIYKPNQDKKEMAVRSLQTSDASNSTAITGGVPGALSNQPPVPATAPLTTPPADPAGANGTPTSSQKEATTNFEVDRTIRHTKFPVGAIKRISVAVVVNNRKVTDDKGVVSYKPLSDDEKAQINQLVSEAVGYDQSRGDTLSIQNAAFNIEEKEVIPEVPLWKQPEMINVGVSMVKYLLIAIVMLIVIFGVIKPALKPLLSAPVKEDEDDFLNEGDKVSGNGESGPTNNGLSPSEQQAAVKVHGAAAQPYEQGLQAARQIAQQDPKIVASVIKEWVNGNE